MRERVDVVLGHRLFNEDQPGLAGHRAQESPRFVDAPALVGIGDEGNAIAVSRAQRLDPLDLVFDRRHAHLQHEAAKTLCRAQVDYGAVVVGRPAAQRPENRQALPERAAEQQRDRHVEALSEDVEQRRADAPLAHR